MIRRSMILIAAAFAAGIVQAQDDRALIEQAALQTGRPIAPTGAERGAVPPMTEEQSARAEANVALAKLQLVLARKAFAAKEYEQAAVKALHVHALLRQLPPEIGVEELALQADGLLLRASREGVKIDQLERDAVETTPFAPGDAEMDRATQAAARIGQRYDGAPRREIDTSGDVRALRDRTMRQQAADEFQYRPGRALVDAGALRAEAEQSVQYEAGLREAIKTDEIRALLAADEARVIPSGVMSYPNDWWERVERRKKWAGGQIARSESRIGKDGQEWYVAIYDIRDLTYVPPDFDPHWNASIREDLRDLHDRREFWDHAYLFFGRNDPYDGLMTLNFFGGLDPIARRGPKYSYERQRQIMNTIEAMVGGEVRDTQEPPELAPAPR